MKLKIPAEIENILINIQTLRVLSPDINNNVASHDKVTNVTKKSKE